MSRANHCRGTDDILGKVETLDGSRRRGRDSQWERLEKAGPPVSVFSLIQACTRGDTHEDATRGPEFFEDHISPLVHGESY